MKKILISFVAVLFSCSIFATTPPDEGMWLPMFIKDYNYATMQKMGLKLTSEQMYDINNSSLKDAIVQLGNFCTGEIVSKDGLMLTNHHCGYSAIATHSTEEHDYLKNGFWAMNKSEELPNEGLTVTFLVRMDDVTKIVLHDITNETPKAERTKKINDAISKLKKEYSKDNKYRVEVKPFYEGNEYYLFIYETYRDVRLVGAPPSGVGKFGGDTDNWIWPRHTGDFAIFRIYTAPDGSPADYAPENIPLQPKHYLPISLKGIEMDDFAMTWGFPGSTERFMTSYEVNNAINIINPAYVETFDVLLPVIRDAMNASDKVRINYSNHYASLSNTWKNKQGETASLIKLKVADKKAKQEVTLRNWINQDPARVAEYGDFFKKIEGVCTGADAYELKSFSYANMTLYTVQTLMLPYKLQGVKPQADDKSYDEKKINSILERYKSLVEKTDPATEAKLIAASLALWEKLPVEQRPDIYNFINKNYKGDYQQFANAIMAKSIYGSVENMTKFLNKPTLKQYDSDPLVQYFNAVFKVIMTSQGAYTKYNNDLETPRRIYLAALREMEKDTPSYPDANSTMRMSYGKVIDYYPSDGVHYLYYTTEQGILEKEKPGDPEFDIPTSLRDLLLAKDFGRYAHNNALPVCFITNNDITGGNSGSPVLNANGEMIGIAFDGNWEALSSDIVFNQELQRCINVDIRYVMFIIDKFAGAGYLLNEMTIVE